MIDVFAALADPEKVSVPELPWRGHGDHRHHGPTVNCRGTLHAPRKYRAKMYKMYTSRRKVRGRNGLILINVWIIVDSWHLHYEPCLLRSEFETKASMADGP